MEGDHGSLRLRASQPTAAPPASIHSPAALAAATTPSRTWSSWTTTSAPSESSLRFRPPMPTSYDDDDDDGAAAPATYDSDDDNDDIGASLRDMETDASVDPAARAALVPWIHDFARHFGVGQDALHRAVSYADRFLSARRAAATPATTGADVDDYQLRLLGAAAVYATSKYEDSRDAAPRMRMNAGDIAARLGRPTAHTFVEHFTRRRRVGHQGQEEVQRRAAHAIADSSLFDHRCLALLPSAVTAAAVLLARLCVEPAHHDRELVRRWSRELEGLTGYKPMDVYDGLDCMYNMLPHHPGFDISPLLFVDPILPSYSLQK